MKQATNVSVSSLASQSRPPRIAILLPDLRIGGAERVSLDLARGLIERGCSIDFVLMQARGEFLKDLPEGARVVDLKSPRVRNIFKPFSTYLRDCMPEAVLVNLWPLTAAATIVAKLTRSKARLVTVDHSTLSSQYSEWGLVSWVALRASIAMIYPFADARVAVSRGVADDIASLGGLRPERIQVIYNPVRVSPSGPRPDESVERIWGGWKGPRIITVGTLKAEKNHALLIHAFKRLLTTCDARLLILGTGDMAEATECLARAEGVADKVLMPGATRWPAPFYLSADLFVLSSDREGLPTVLIEALAYGLPVVSTNCRSGPAEILENGRYGRLVPVGDADALARAMGEALGANHDREALRWRAQYFSPKRAADQYLKVLLPNRNRECISTI